MLEFLMLNIVSFKMLAESEIEYFINMIVNFSCLYI